jgi:methylenetetrahydrofolate dehydrogenase (NADP+)/methenyltetrahydrofolate cyclohydrolase
MSLTVLMKGTDVVNSLINQMTHDITELKDKEIIPGLAIVRLGSNPDDISYERNVIKKCEKLGVNWKVYNLEESTSNDDLKNELTKINGDIRINGILVFRPLPKQIDESLIKSILNPAKDIDCLTSVNVAKVFEGDESGYYPCTAESIMEILDFYNINLEGKKVVIVGRSMVVGKPLAMMMLKRNATITICHSKTHNLKEVCKNAEIIVAALGKAKFITNDYISPGSTVIDVGINVDSSGNLCGDVDFDNVQKIASYITPVPGGVGTVTSSVLIKNVIKATKMIQ